MEYIIGILLLVVSALCNSVYRLLIKSSDNRLVLFSGLNMIAALIGVVGVWFVPMLPKQAFPYLVGASISYTCAMFFLSCAYRYGAFSTTTPLLGAIRVIVIAMLSAILLDEPTNFLHWVAVFLVIISFLVLTHPEERNKRGYWAAALLAIITGMFSGLHITLDAGGVRSVDNAATYIVWNLFIGLPIVVYSILKFRARMFNVLMAQADRIIGGSILDIVGYALVLFVVYNLAILDILPFMNVHIIISAILGVMVLHERFGVRRLMASVLLFAAAVTVSYA